MDGGSGEKISLDMLGSSYKKSLCLWVHVLSEGHFDYFMLWFGSMTEVRGWNNLGGPGKSRTHAGPRHLSW